MIALLQDPTFIGLTHAAAALAALGAALAFTTVMRANKGARVNVAMILFALGCVLLGVAGATLTLRDLGLVDLAGWYEPLAMLGVLCILAGALYWRRLIVKMTK